MQLEEGLDAMKRIHHVACLILSLNICLFLVCSKINIYEPDNSSTTDEDIYAVTIPPGKLAWPHHRPDLTQAEYEDLLENLWIINNFGLYQASESNAPYYFHSGLDVILDNGTKVYAIESGYVKSIRSGATISIGQTSGQNSGYAWEYVHVDNIQFDIGDFVQKGDYVADIYFEGLPHLHLSRVYHAVDGNWDHYWRSYYLHPDDFFIYADTEPPVIKTPFYFFQNNSDEMFAIQDTTVISGDVDIVVGIRDPGEFARSKTSGFGDRLCIAKVEYEIKGVGGVSIEPVHEQSFDFGKINLQKERNLRDERLFVVFKHHSIFHPDGISYNRFFSYYIITNTDGTGESEKVKLSDHNYAWNTAALDESGNPRFPNGLYTIIVRAYDARGNSSQANEIVRVMNP